VNGAERRDLALSDYREFRPPAALSEFLLCFWAQTIRSPAEFHQRVLPDACVDILLLNELPMVAGPWTEPFIARLPPHTEIIGARCHPGLAPSLLGIPASELLNRYLPLREVWSSSETDSFARVAGESALSFRMAAMAAAVSERLARARPPDDTVKAAIQWIARRPRGRVEELGRWLGLSSRQIQRRFAGAVGYGPKLFQSVLRFQRLLHLAARPGTGCSLAQFAADADYADQAHMTREVRRFSGTIPSRSLASPRSTLRLSGLIGPLCTPDS
jgi:AraC-like DNA-binding protein